MPLRQPIGSSESPFTGRSLHRFEGLAVHRIWPELRQCVEIGCSHTQGRVHPELVRDRVSSNQTTLWVLVGPYDGVLGVVGGDVEHHGSDTILVVWLCGTLRGAIAYEEMRWVMGEIEAFAEGNGFQAIELHGRTGWSRLFKGYEEAYRVFSKELGHG